MKWRSWDELEAELNAKVGLTEEEIERKVRELEAYAAGYRLAERRNKNGITQAELAQRMDVDQSRVSAIERGDIEALTVASVRSYVEALGGTVRLQAHFDDTDTDTDTEIMMRIPESAV